LQKFAEALAACLQKLVEVSGVLAKLAEALRKKCLQMLAEVSLLTISGQAKVKKLADQRLAN
jgi:hypothetical protein